MTYGPEKITATKAIESILEVIKDDLLKQDAFANQSMAYYGIELSYTINLKLHARKETPLGIEGSHDLGEKVDAKPKEVKVRGKRVAGRKLTVSKGEHTRDREGVAV